MTLESGIVIPVPEAEGVVGRFRTLHDPQARFGVPAHITLLYPFDHPSKVSRSLSSLQNLFAEVPPFEFSLAEVRRFPETVFLHPEPVESFVSLTEKLVRAWPEFPPYGGAFASVIPHLTVADRAATDVLDTVAESIARSLPLRCRATEAWLLCSDEQGIWSLRKTFRLGQSES